MSGFTRHDYISDARPAESTSSVSGLTSSSICLPPSIRIVIARAAVGLPDEMAAIHYQQQLLFDSQNILGSI
ncbi:unnamed protein product [Protopolystoma xenopodis]|uniref:Uncharacterized protein n=1 Tax=Protopolystoma xenopodis TaxID=117903 RepID=A0A3S5A391_9PLAT|nr:unnamed protein product [Protopolystoma xenopodis]